MSSTDIQQLLSRRLQLLQELQTLARILHGSWVERFSVCSRPGCACHSGQRHGPRYYLVINQDSHQRQKYIPNEQVTAAREGVAQHQRLQQIVEEITMINLALIKERAYVQS